MLGMEIVKTNLSYHIFNPSYSYDHEPKLVESVYQMWSRVWSEAFAELGEDEQLKSDDFTRHREVGALFVGSEPVGLCLYSDVDLSSEIWQRDSYFSAWPKEVLSGIAEKWPGKNVLICCYFTIAQDWRGTPGGVSYKSTLVGLATQHLLSSDCGVMVGTMRKNKGMAKQTYVWGARPVYEDQMMHGVKVDLVVFERESYGPPTDPYVKEAWDNRVIHPGSGVSRTETKKAA